MCEQIPQDFGRAVRYLSRAAEQGNVPASGQLAFLLAQQLPGLLGAAPSAFPHPSPSLSPLIPPSTPLPASAEEGAGAGAGFSDERIFELSEFAALRGDPNGMTGLALAYLRGIGTDTNATKAVCRC